MTERTIYVNGSKATEEAIDRIVEELPKSVKVTADGSTPDWAKLARYHQATVIMDEQDDPKGLRIGVPDPQDNVESAREALRKTLSEVIRDIEQCH